MSKAKALELAPGLTCEKRGESDFAILDHGRLFERGFSARDAWANAIDKIEKRKVRRDKPKSNHEPKPDHTGGESFQGDFMHYVKPEPIPAPPDFAGLRKVGESPNAPNLEMRPAPSLDFANSVTVLRLCLARAEAEAEKCRRALAILEGGEHV